MKGSSLPTKAQAHLSSQLHSVFSISNLPQVLQQRVHQTIETFMQSLVTLPEPQLSRWSDRQGNQGWRMQNSATGEIVYFPSEEAARIWVERRSGL